jgi:hypothetical protein
MAHVPDAATATMIANLEANTGRTLAQWVGFAKRSGKAKHGELVAWLKAEGLTHKELVGWLKQAYGEG